MTTSSPKLTVTYDIRPPEDLKTSSLLPTATHSWPIISAPADCVSYYHQLSAALVSAKERVGLELTAWKEAMGDVEKTSQKPNKTEHSSQADEEEQEPEEE